jgi:hypothetical protein
MVYWIGINVISNNQGLLNAVENVIPDKIDNRLWQTSEYQANKGIDDDGNNFFYASLFFDDITERDNFHVVLRGINGMLHSAMAGSYIKMTKCWHDEKVNGLCTKLDELTFEEVV